MLEISNIDHIGVRVADATRANEFYAKLGFEVAFRSAVAPVVVLRDARGTELHLVVNADQAFDGTNVLLDDGPKRAGYTHIALRVPSIAEAERALAELGVTVTEGPVALGEGVSLFLRDPDRNVIELHEHTRSTQP